MRVLITGVTGMAGSHLAEYALKLPNVQVFGTYRWRSKMDTLADLAGAGRIVRIGGGGNVRSASELAKRIDEEAVEGSLNLLLADLTDPSSIRRLVAGVSGPHRNRRRQAYMEPDGLNRFDFASPARGPQRGWPHGSHLERARPAGLRPSAVGRSARRRRSFWRPYTPRPDHRGAHPAFGTVQAVLRWRAGGCLLTTGVLAQSHYSVFRR